MRNSLVKGPLTGAERQKRYRDKWLQQPVIVALERYVKIDPEEAASMFVKRLEPETCQRFLLALTNAVKAAPEKAES